MTTIPEPDADPAGEYLARVLALDPAEHPAEVVRLRGEFLGTRAPAGTRGVPADAGPESDDERMERAAARERAAIASSRRFSATTRPPAHLLPPRPDRPSPVEASKPGTTEGGTSWWFWVVAVLMILRLLRACGS
jgi:hypothetical protein